MATDPSIKELSSAIREEALQLGFSGCGFAMADLLSGDGERLKEWLERGHHANMGYMGRNLEKRTDPAKLVEGARSIISLLYNYYTDRHQMDPEAPVISKYAYGKDYHRVMKDKLYRLFALIREMRPEAEGRVFVDSAPVLERAWAREAGLGWIGKNSCLITRSRGSFVFIGEIIINLELEYNLVPESDFCGSCNRCLEACPTGAILDNRTLDARRCISYQTIENRGEIPEELRGKLANRLFGCDICQDVCPWNRRALPHREPAFLPATGCLEMDADAWQALDRERYGLLFSHTPLERAGFSKIRNTLGILGKAL